MSLNKQKVTSLGLLRAIAVIAVCFCHFAKPLSNGSFQPEIYKIIADYGEYGVQIFFVVSGFVIPYSLHRGNYTLKDYPTFLLKRFLRLHPPYLVSLLITLFLSYFSYKSKGLAFPETTESIIKSLFYAKAPTGNPVYWTLRVEAQYYLFIGLFFVLLSKFKNFSIWVLMPVFLILSRFFLAEYVAFFHFLVFFLIGIVGYFIYQGSKVNYFDIGALCGLVAYSGVYYGPAATIVSALTVLVILFYKKPVKPWLEFTGEISYSLYLIHFPVGVKIVNLLQKKVPANLNWLLFFITTGVCYALSVALYNIVEKKATGWSNKFKYQNNKKQLTI